MISIGKKHKILLAVVAGVLLLIAVVICVLYLDREDYTRKALQQVAASSGVEMNIGKIEIDAGGRLEFRDVDLGALGKIDFIEIGWGWKDLASSRIRQIRVYGLQLRSSELAKLQKKDAAGSSDDAQMRPFILDKLIIGQAVLILDDLGTGIPPVPIRLGEVTPLLFEDLHLGGKTSDPAASQLQRVVINDLTLYSPYNQLAEVLTFEKITLAFSWAGIQARQLDQLVIEKPMIYVGDDLFSFVDQVQKKDAVEDSSSEVAAEVPWSIGNFSLVGGKLKVTALGNPGFVLPIIYEMEQVGLVLDDFSNAPLKMNLEIPPTNLNYPEYGIRVSNLNGKMEFSLPPGDQTVDNIVNTVHMDSISWKGVTSTEAWVTITFDKNGIYAQLGGESYGGYTEGKLSILVNEGMKWVADASITDTQVRTIAEKLAPEYIVFDGVVNGQMQVWGQQQNIQSAKGDFKWQQPGKMTVLAVDDFLEKLPAEWTALKKDMASAALVAFRDYDYYQGDCRFNFEPPKSFIDLQFDGKQGKRHFNINWNDLRENPGFGW
jgi:hypothetical protein